jgi:hypothetical protein
MSWYICWKRIWIRRRWQRCWKNFRSEEGWEVGIDEGEDGIIEGFAVGEEVFFFWLK